MDHFKVTMVKSVPGTEQAVQLSSIWKYLTLKLGYIWLKNWFCILQAYNNGRRRECDSILTFLPFRLGEDMVWWVVSQNQSTKVQWAGVWPRIRSDSGTPRRTKPAKSRSRSNHSARLSDFFPLPVSLTIFHQNKLSLSDFHWRHVIG